MTGCKRQPKVYTQRRVMSMTHGGSVSQPKRASQRFRRLPATGALQEARRAWGKEWGNVNSLLAKRLRAGRG